MKKLTKIAKVETPMVESASSIEEYGNSVWSGLFEGIDSNHLSPPVEYWVAGEIEPIEVGKPIVMYRKIRNGVEKSGIFHSSIVTKLAHSHDGNVSIIQTNNSVYMLEDYV